MDFNDDLNFLLTNGVSLDEISELQKRGLSLREIRQRAEDAITNGEPLRFDGSTVLYNAKSAIEFGESDTRFIWEPYIPIGDYTVMMADGGTGKTILCCGIAAAISRGEPLPGDYSRHNQKKTLIISAEDTGALLKKRLSVQSAVGGGR